MTERVVLAHSGGLDTPVAIGWTAEETGAEVVPSELAAARDERLSSGSRS